MCSIMSMLLLKVLYFSDSRYIENQMFSKGDYLSETGDHLSETGDLHEV